MIFLNSLFFKVCYDKKKSLFLIKQFSLFNYDLDSHTLLYTPTFPFLYFGYKVVIN